MVIERKESKRIEKGELGRVKTNELSSSNTHMSKPLVFKFKDII